MTSAARLRRAAVLFALLVVSASFAIQAQSTGPKPITLDDYPKFKRITNAVISTDGKWMLYTLTPNEGDGTLVVRALDGDKTFDVPRGTSAAFSDDARWVGYFIAPPASAERGDRGGRGGRGGNAPAPVGGANAGAQTAPPRTFEVLELSTGTKTTFPSVGSFAFSPEGDWLLMRPQGAQAAATDTPSGRGGRGGAPGAAAAGESAGPGTDLLMRELSTGTQRYIGKVGAYAFDDAGKQMAYTVRGEQRLGNGVYLMALATGEQKIPRCVGRRLRPVGVERRGRESCRASGRQAERQDPPGERRPHLAQRRNTPDEGGDVRSGQGDVVPGGNGRQRVHRASME